jgi:NAD(P)-dependent dehydrogenase (short-subunit alcohol dehydrogenase family)
MIRRATAWSTPESYDVASAVSFNVRFAEGPAMKVALVTGAGSGIGRAAALALLDHGWHVVLAGRRLEALEQTVREAGAHGANALAVPTDAGRAESVEALFAAIRNTFGRLDLLFNNAGIGAPAVPLDEITVEQWQAVVDINLTAAFLCTQQAFRIMKSQDPRGAGSSTTARSRRTRRGRSAPPTPRPSTPSPA